MNKFILLTFMSVLYITPVCAKYYCESDELRGEYIPNISEACSHWKDMDMSGMYNTCLRANKLGEKAFKAGECELIVEKTYHKGNELCIEQITQKTKKIIGTACVGK